jgi:hypothetical protein
VHTSVAVVLLRGAPQNQKKMFDTQSYPENEFVVLIEQLNKKKKKNDGRNF